MFNGLDEQKGRSFGGQEDDQKFRAGSEEDNIFSNRGSANPNDNINKTHAIVPSADAFNVTNIYNTNQENSAIDLVGLGGQDQPMDDFEEYEDDNTSLKIKDTTYQSDGIKNTLMMNLGDQSQNNDVPTTRDSNLIIPLRPNTNHSSLQIQNASGNYAANKGANLVFDGDDAIDAVAMELDLLNNQGSTEVNGGLGKAGGQMGGGSKFKVRVFLNMDEEDDGALGIDPRELFEPTENNLPFYIDLHIQDHFDCNQLVITAINEFNQHLQAAANGLNPSQSSNSGAPKGQYMLDDNPANFSDLYNLYTARKKKGTAKDDFPSLSLQTNVKRTNADNFSLSCFSKAFLPATNQQNSGRLPATTSGNFPNLASNPQIRESTTDNILHNKQSEVKVKSSVESMTTIQASVKKDNKGNREQGLDQLTSQAGQDGCCNGSCTIF